MNPEVWGPHMWFIIDSIILNYPDNPSMEDKNDMIQFFSLLEKILPCVDCRMNYKTHYNSSPLTYTILESKNAFIEWGLELHNKVNRMKGKNIITKEDFIDYYSNQYGGKVKYTTIFSLVFIILVLILLMFYIIKY